MALLALMVVFSPWHKLEMMHGLFLVLSNLGGFFSEISIQPDSTSIVNHRVWRWHIF